MENRRVFKSMGNFINQNNAISNLILNSNELIMLLNELYLDSNTRFTITDCLYGLNLFNVRISDKIEIELAIKLNDIKDTYNKIPNELREEFPSKSRFFEIFTKSGFYFETYEKEFENLIEELENLNILEGDVPIALFFDTNLYYDQFFTQLSNLLKKKYRKPKYPIYFLLSEGVKKELITYEHKYKVDDIEKMKENCAYPDIIEEFFNQNKFKARIKHLGHIDFLKCNENVYSKIIEEDETIDKNDMDSRIIQGIIKEIRQQNIKLYLYSQDSDFIARARGNRNLITKHLEKIPQSMLKNKYCCEWEMFNRFLYNLVITFGTIIIDIPNNSNLFLFGIWRGKKLNDWEKENLKIISSNPILERIEKDLLILNNIKIEEGFIN